MNPGIERRVGRAVRDGAGAFDAGDLGEPTRDERPWQTRDRRRVRASWLTCEQRRDEHVARELIAGVDHVRTHGATREGARTQLAELVSLAHIKCDRHDLDTQGVDQPGNRRRGVNPTCIREHDR